MLLNAQQMRVLSAIQLDAELTMQEVVDRCRINYRTARSTIELLEAEGVIRPTTRVQPAAMGLRKFFVWGRLSPTGICRETEVVSYIQQSPEVSWLDTYHGDFHLLLGIYGTGRPSIDRYLDGMSQRLGYVFEKVVVLPEESWTVFERKLLMTHVPINPKYVGRVTYGGYRDNWSKLDDMDFRLVEYLSHNPLDSNKHVGEVLGLSQQSVGRRKRILEQREILLGTYYQLNRQFLGLGAGCYLVKIQNVTPKIRRQMDEFCALERSVWAYGPYGPTSEYSFGITVEGGSEEELWSLRKKLIERFNPALLEYSSYRDTKKHVADVAEYKKRVHSERLS